MRDLTEKENDLLNLLVCPFCADTKFFSGLSGVASENIRCSNYKCQAEFCFHGGFFTAQLIKESNWIAPTKPAEITDSYDDSLLDFMTPKKQTWLSKIRENIGI